LNYILGSGITSLILKVYLKNYKIIGNKLGGQLSSCFQLGPRILKKTQYTEDFFKRINYYPELKTYKIGYYYADKIHSMCDIENRCRYFTKTRGTCLLLSESSMNDGLNVMNGYDLDDLMLIKIIESIDKKDLIEENIISIDIKKSRIFTYNNIYKYNKIINTIPVEDLVSLLNIFYRLEVNYISVIFLLLDKKYFNIDLKDFDFVYFTDYKYAFHRVTNLNRFLCIEVRKDRISEIDEKILKKSKKFLFKRGILVDDKNYDNIEDIECIGRYAQVSHKIRSHNVIQKALEMSNE